MDAPEAALALEKLKFATREELCIMMTAAQSGMAQFGMRDPAWRLFEDVWKAAVRLGHLAE